MTLSRKGMETYKASPVTNTQNDTNVVSKYYPVLVLVGRGDGISQGRAHARGESTPGAPAHHRPMCIMGS